MNKLQIASTFIFNNFSKNKKFIFLIFFIIYSNKHLFILHTKISFFFFSLYFFRIIEFYLIFYLNKNYNKINIS